MAQSYKSLKEDFVSNLSGGTISEINLVTAVAPAAVLLWAILQSNRGFFREPSIPAYLGDFMLNVGGILLVTTLYSLVPGAFVTVLLASSVAYVLLPSQETSASPPRPAKPASKSKTNGKDKSAAASPSAFPPRPFLSYYRGSMMVVTCISILAVDFPVFPRRFAKVETWGTSLMDLGVGSFVFSAGLVAAKGPLKDRIAARSRSLMQRTVGAVRAAVPLMVLGGARLLSVKKLDYAEHVSEYGIHWNFFFTMAAVPLALSLLQPAIEALPGPRYALAGLLLACADQALLTFTHLQAWALTAPRDTLLTANREGITSVTGYLAIFLLGMSAGTIVLPRAPNESELTFRLLNLLGVQPGGLHSTYPPADVTRARLFVTLWLSAGIYTLLLVAFSLPHYLPPILTINISRRLANLPYVLWIAAFNNAQIAAFCLVESLCFPAMHRAKTPIQEKEQAEFANSRVLEAFNQGGLLLFLLANLGTGAVNLSVDTLNADPFVAVGVLAAYMGALTVLAINLKGIKLKL